MSPAIATLFERAFSRATIPQLLAALKAHMFPNDRHPATWLNKGSWQAAVDATGEPDPGPNPIVSVLRENPANALLLSGDDLRRNVPRELWRELIPADRLARLDSAGGAQ